MADTHIHAGSPGAHQSGLGAIIVGTLVALGLMVLFTLLGLAIGVASLEAVGEGLGIGAALYIIVTQIISLAAGGFAAARFMAPVETGAGVLAGTAVWALASLLVAWGGISAGTTVISSTTSLVVQTSKTTANAVQAITPEDISMPDISEIAGSISMADLPPELQQTLRDENLTPSQLREAAREAFRSAISQQEMNRAKSLLSATLSDIIENPTTFSEEVNQALDQLIKGENAILNEQDLSEARNALLTELDISEAQAEQIVNEVQSAFEEAVETLRQTVSELQDRVVRAANEVQNAVASAAMWLFIASLLGLGAAAGAGALGRRS